jgi:hypothetical protein
MNPTSPPAATKTLATDRALVASYLLALGGVPYPVKPIIVASLARAH